MRTFWDQVVALVEQGDRPQGAGAPAAECERVIAQVGARGAALRAQCQDIGQALDQLERLKGLFRSFLSPVSELVLEFEVCTGRLEETTVRLAALEEAHRDLVARHVAALEDRNRLAARASALDDARVDLGACRNAGEMLQRLIEAVSSEIVARAGEIERLAAELGGQGRALAGSQAALRDATERCAGLEAKMASRSDQTGEPVADRGAVEVGQRPTAT